MPSCRPFSPTAEPRPAASPRRYPDITPSESEPLLGQDGARPNARESARLRSNGSRGASAGQAQVDSAADDPDAGLPPIDRRGPEHGPVYLPCGHAFCGECISRHLRQGPAGRPSCPICRATFDDDMQPRRDPPRQADPRRAPPGSRFGRGYYSDRCYMGMDYDMYDMEYRYR